MKRAFNFGLIITFSLFTSISFAQDGAIKSSIEKRLAAKNTGKSPKVTTAEINLYRPLFKLDAELNSGKNNTFLTQLKECKNANDRYVNNEGGNLLRKKAVKLFSDDATDFKTELETRVNKRSNKKNEAYDFQNTFKKFIKDNGVVLGFNQRLYDYNFKDRSRHAKVIQSYGVVLKEGKKLVQEYEKYKPVLGETLTTRNGRETYAKYIGQVKAFKNNTLLNTFIEKVVTDRIKFLEDYFNTQSKRFPNYFLQELITLNDIQGAPVFQKDVNLSTKANQYIAKIDGLEKYVNSTAYQTYMENNAKLLEYYYLNKSRTATNDEIIKKQVYKKTAPASGLLMKRLKDYYANKRVNTVVKIIPVGSVGYRKVQKRTTNNQKIYSQSQRFVVVFKDKKDGFCYINTEDVRFMEKTYAIVSAKLNRGDRNKRRINCNNVQ